MFVGEGKTLESAKMDAAGKQRMFLNVAVF